MVLLKQKLHLKKIYYEVKLYGIMIKKKDWKAYLGVNHPCISICKAPRHHPFTKCERLALFIIDICMSIYIAVIVNLMTANLCDSDKIDINDTSNAYDTSNVYDTSNAYDCPGQKTFALPLIDKTFDTPPTKMILYGQILSTVFSIFNAISNRCLRGCATCGCLQNNSSGKRCRRCLECCGGCCVWYQFFAAVGIATALSMYMWSENKFTLFMLNFAAGRIWSLVFAYFKMKFCFNRLWKKEKENAGKKLNKFKVTYIDYELYVNGNQIEHPPKYKPNRKNTIGTITLETHAQGKNIHHE
eukprot:681369_1